MKNQIVMKILVGRTAIGFLLGALIAWAAPEDGLARVQNAADEGTWKLLTFPGIAPSRFTLRPDGGIDVIAEESSAMFYRPVSAAEKGQRFLTWQWRVDEASPPTNLAEKGEDDRPLAVHLWFPAPREERGFLDRMMDDLDPRPAKFPHDGKVLTYVWGGTHAPGEKLPNPYLGGRGVMIVLRDGDTPTERWFTEKIDFARDYEMAFGYAPASPGFIAVSGDTDDTRSRSAGTVAEIAFVKG